VAVSAVTGRTLRVCALYPELLNIYADRGNLLLLRRRCEWREIEFRLSASGLREPLDSAAHDLYYIGGGQDRDQRLCAEDLLEHKREALHAASARGAVVLGICGGYQLLGHSYAIGQDLIEGVGLLDVETVREPGPRLIGNVAIEVSLPGAAATSNHEHGFAGTPHDQHGRRSHATARILAGFENHGGRTRLGPDAQPLGRVLRGHGNDGRSGFEGARRGLTIGTYLHGPLLPKNAWFADWLIAKALGVAVEELALLDDAFERSAHANALRAAGI